METEGRVAGGRLGMLQGLSEPVHEDAHPIKAGVEQINQISDGYLKVF